uniref:Uncharacterized protein n=1 Tax=Nelumbo nucifera TaxID=4432 RepID=A0A822YW93_NELNU|nr:TPA_asm: hypothetical protein HUJ06_008995 [Nelumbo nucifera]
MTSSGSKQTFPMFNWSLGALKPAVPYMGSPPSSPCSKLQESDSPVQPESSGTKASQDDEEILMGFCLDNGSLSIKMECSP